MKKLIVMSTLTLLVLCLNSLMSHAQDEPKKYQGWMVWEDHVQPSKASAYEAAVKKQMANIKAHNFSQDINVFSTDDYIYYWSVAIDDFADIDTLYKKFGKIYKDTDEATNVEIDNALDGTYEYSKPWVCTWYRDLSYIPEVQPEGDLDFKFWGFCKVKQGKDEEMREVFKKWVELYKSKGIERGFSTFVVDVGTDMPFMFWFISDKNFSEYTNNDKKINDILGKEANVLWAETEALMRGFESQTGWYRSDLSYTPGN
jgi:hypothetical protein